MTLIRSLAIASLVLACGTAAQAQTANSAGSSASTGGGSTVPQFPSGGATGANGGAAAPGGAKIGAPTPVEQQEQRKSDQATKMICKGC